MRNRAPILEVLRTVLPAQGLVLEIASGTGEHARFFAQALPGLVWLPSDPNADCRASIAAHAGAAGVSNVLPALNLDVAAPGWARGVTEQHGSVDAALCVNLLHVTAWTTIDPMMAGVADLLSELKADPTPTLAAAEERGRAIPLDEVVAEISMGGLTQ